MILLSFCLSELTLKFFTGIQTLVMVARSERSRRAGGEKFRGKIHGTKHSFGLLKRKADLGNGELKKIERWMSLYFLGRGCRMRDKGQVQQQQEAPGAGMTPGKLCCPRCSLRWCQGKDWVRYQLGWAENPVALLQHNHTRSCTTPGCDTHFQPQLSLYSWFLYNCS